MRLGWKSCTVGKHIYATNLPSNGTNSQVQQYNGKENAISPSLFCAEVKCTCVHCWNDAILNICKYIISANLLYLSFRENLLQYVNKLEIKRVKLVYLKLAHKQLKHDNVAWIWVKGNAISPFIRMAVLYCYVSHLLVLFFSENIRKFDPLFFSVHGKCDEVPT